MATLDMNRDIWESNMLQIELMCEYQSTTGKSIEEWIDSFSARFRDIWNNSPSNSHTKSFIASRLYSSAVSNIIN